MNMISSKNNVNRCRQSWYQKDPFFVNMVNVVVLDDREYAVAVYWVYPLTVHSGFQYHLITCHSKRETPLFRHDPFWLGLIYKFALCLYSYFIFLFYVIIWMQYFVNFMCIPLQFLFRRYTLLPVTRANFQAGYQLSYYFQPPELTALAGDNKY